MRVCVSALVLNVAIAMSCVRAVSAQTSNPLQRLSVEGTFGLPRVRGGDPLERDNNLGVVDLGVTFRALDSRRGSLLVGVNRASYLPHGNDATCPVRPGTTRCVPDYPEFAATSLLVGWQSPRPQRGSLRLLMGPGLYRADNRDIGNSLGLQARIDVASPALWHVSLVTSARAWVVPNAEGTRYRQMMLGLGLRIH
jgi:hypothetical protein